MSTKSPDQNEAACDAYFAQFEVETIPYRDITKSTSFILSIIRKIVGWKDPMLEPRKRPGAGGHPSTTPARIQHLEKRVLMSANPLLTGIDAPNWDAAPDGLRGEMTPQAGTFIFDFDISPDGTEFITTNKDGSLTFYNALTGDARLTVADHPSHCNDIDYSPDGAVVATAGSDNSVNLRDAQTGNLLKTLKFSGSCSTIAFSPDGNTLAVGVYEQSIHVIDLRTGTDRTIAYDGAVPVCTFSSDGSTIAVTGKNSVALYSTATLQKTNTFTGLADNAYALEFDATGRFVIAGDNAGHVTVWDRTTGQMVDETADLRGHPQVAGGIRSMNVTADGKAIGVVDWSGNGIVYDMGQLTAGQGLTEMMRFQTKGSGWGVEFSPSGKSIISSGTAANVTTLQVFAMPEPPAPPSTASSNADAPDEPVSPTSGTDATPDINATVMSLATERMEELETSIHDVAEDIPALIRRQAELERDLAAKAGPLAAQQKTVDTLRKTHADTVEAYHRYQAEYDATVKRSPKTAAKIKPLLENAWRGTYYYADRVREAEVVLNGLIGAEQAVRQELATVVSTLQTSYDTLSSQRAEFVACAELAGTSVDTAIEQVDIIVRAAVKEGEEALPHLRATIDVRDRNASSYNPRILVLDKLVTEVKSHQIPSNATKLDVLFRVANDGNRDGYVTVTIGGVSDLSPDLYKPQTVSIFLRAGEKRDISAIVEIPQGSDGKRTGGFGITVATLDEATVALQVKQKGATPMLTDAEKKLNEMPGAAAAYHNAQVILLSEGIGTPEERLERYLAANPTQASLIAGMMESGELKADLAFNESFLTAYRTATSVAGKMANEVAVGMENTPHIQQGTIETTLNLLAMNNIDGLQIEGVSVEQAQTARGFWDAMRADVNTESTQTHLAELEKLSFRSEGQLAITFGDQRVRIDTTMGRIMMGIAPLLRQYQSAQWSLAQLCVRIEAVSGIDATRLYTLARTATDARFEQGLLALCQQYGYNLSEVPPQGRELTTTVQYHGDMVRVIINPGDLKQFDHARINLMADGVIKENAVAWKEGALFVDIPATVFKDLSNPSIKVIAWFKGEGDGTTAYKEMSLDTTKMVFTNTRSIIELPSSIDSAGNKALLQYIADNFETTWHLTKVSETMWEGDLHGTGLKECKEWLDDVVVRFATGVDLPQNEPVPNGVPYGSTGKWVETNLQNITVQARVDQPGTFSQVFLASDVKAGDIVQVYGTFGPHTMLIGKIESDGIWVLDTNFGERDEPLLLSNSIDQSKVTLLMKDPNNSTHYMSNQEAESLGITFNATHYLQQDNTVRYHKIYFANLDKTIYQSSIYRVSPN